MKLSPAMVRRLKQHSRTPDMPLLTHQLQRSAAILYAHGLLTWSRNGYRISSAGLDYLAAHTMESTRK